MAFLVFYFRDFQEGLEKICVFTLLYFTKNLFTILNHIDFEHHKIEKQTSLTFLYVVTLTIS